MKVHVEINILNKILIERRRKDNTLFTVILPVRRIESSNLNLKI